ncbi:MAG: carbon-nitrogen hydrolase family protein [Sphingomonadaceae bacterium]|uniref:carbon-nitrogen hydrolase family protein n=1 Tax=Thermaurantiacus sp. TaxID=2820283 RepID=UPI00298EE620|nr:carbon-nitrogen hydrolase family protein [Thermaurantiacus sp.]MCS6986356.1 carbon-nitrogen hydrolase family protein [Sphingomonadaceae bacterium]MDW8414382.1 carbon-nitrogen hydrolase family protein [Thermaurantiacus sp.]
MTAGIVQTTTGLDRAANTAGLVRSVERLAAQGARIVFMPEMCGLLDRDPARLKAAAQPEAEDPTLEALRKAAERTGVAIAVGSLAIRRDDGRLANRSFLLGPDGRIMARYDKIHLFDVDLPGGERIRESASFAAGDRAVVAHLPWGGLGLSVCYDVRFPALYRALAAAGAVVLAVPAAFTVPTGRAHWHVLVRARAIETGSFVVAAAQTGRHADGRETFGHALVVDPWGEVLLDMGEAPGEALVVLDLDRVAEVRRRIPALAHARPFTAPAGL